MSNLFRHRRLRGGELLLGIQRHTLIKAALAAATLNSPLAAKEQTMQTQSDPRDPTQVPPGDLGDAVGTPPAETEFNEGDDETDEFMDDEDDQYDDGEEDE